MCRRKQFNRVDRAQKIFKTAKQLKNSAIEHVIELVNNLENEPNLDRLCIYLRMLVSKQDID